MQKIILVDGNNLLFRSYYATAYNGNFMKNSKGFPTNALFGFTNMINKIVSEEKPTHMIVAFDKGKTFRHDKYETYKDGRIETPNELKMQFPIAKEMLGYMGIKYYEIDNYEADDILGTFAHFCDMEEDFIGTIISSDRDLLQLISHDVDIKLLKQKDYIRYNEETFKEEYGIDPIRIIDLKALMGDSSDNIPGVKGIGEKTALKLLQQYEGLDGIYSNIDNIKGSVHEKLVNDKDNAYMSYDLATIVRDVPMEINIYDVKVKEKNVESLTKLYEELEFYSFLKKEKESKMICKHIEVKVINNVEEIPEMNDCAIYLEILGTNYHKAEILGMGIYNNEVSIFVPYEILKNNPQFLTTVNKYTYDLKKVYVSLKWHNIDISNVTFDTMIASSLLDYNVKDDIAYLANEMDYDIDFYDNVYGKGTKLNKPNLEIIAKESVKKAKFIYETYSDLKKQLEVEKMNELCSEIELPLAIVLGKMEYNGVYVDKDILIEMGEEIKIKIDLLSQDIYNHAGCEFNISSPYQLGEILFEKLSLPHGKKGSRGYSTAIDVLQKLQGVHPIIDLIIEHRALTKLYSTYIEGLIASIMSDNKIHTIYTQVLTRTGRLSSIEPNLQNIPIRSEYGKLIRKAFLPSKDSLIVSADYSQIELRILAHMAEVPALREAFIEGKDIHTKTASDIFGVPIEMVTKEMRYQAKAVNFGILYGISSFGLGEDLNVDYATAKRFIDSYLESYPEIKLYMDDVIKSAYEKGFVKTIMNRKRTIEELTSKNFAVKSSGERIALNTPVQGSSADILKKAMVEIYEEFKKRNLKSKMLIQVHDELVINTIENEKSIVTKIVQDIMENTYKLDVPLKVEISMGNNLYDAK